MSETLLQAIKCIFRCFGLFYGRYCHVFNFYFSRLLFEFGGCLMYPVYAVSYP
jgi:hypothetical protein